MIRDGKSNQNTQHFIDKIDKIMETFDEYEIMVERLRRIDKKEYLDENEHRFILESIKACFRETIHQRDFIKQLESKIKEYENLMGTPIQDIMKRLKVLEILKKQFSKEKIFAVKVINSQNEPLYSLEDETTRHFFLESQEEFNLIEEWLNGKD